MNRKQKQEKKEKLMKLAATDWDAFLAEELKDPTIKKAYDYYGRQLELSYGLLQLRKKAKMSQAELAKKVGTTQSNIARIESGNQNMTISTLDKLAQVFGKELKISIV